MAEGIRCWIERWLKLCFLEWLQWLQWSPQTQLLDVVWCSAVGVVVVVWCSGVVAVVCNKGRHLAPDAENQLAFSAENRLALDASLLTSTT